MATDDLYTQRGRAIWRDFPTDGVPSDERHEPLKSEIRTWATEVEEHAAAAADQAATVTEAVDTALDAAETALVLAQVAGGYAAIYDTYAAADAGKASIADGKYVMVLADELRASAQTVYKKVGAALVYRITLTYTPIDLVIDAAATYSLFETYKDEGGTIALTAGDTKVTGSGTSWSGVVLPGDILIVGSRMQVIDRLGVSPDNPNTVLYLNRPWGGQNYLSGGQPYTILFVSPQRRSAMLNYGANLFEDAGRFGGSPEPQSNAVTSYTAPTYLSVFNSAAFAAGPKFLNNNTTYGGTAGSLDPKVDALISRLKNSSTRRFGVEFYLLQITAGSGTVISTTVESVVHYLAFQNSSVPLWQKSTLNFYIYVESGSVAFPFSTTDPLYIDGTRQTAAYRLQNAGGWKQVTWRIDRDPQSYAGFDNTVFRTYATPGSVFYLALPALIPAQIPIKAGVMLGSVPSQRAFR